MANIIDTLVARGFAPELTNPALKELSGREMVTFYVGFDPTADSLHIGSLKQIMMMALVEVQGKTVEEAARIWIEQNENVWSRWMPETEE